MKFLILLLLLLWILFFNKKSSFENSKIKNNPFYGIYNKNKNKFTTVKGKSSLNGVDMVYAITMPQRKQYISDQVNKLGVSCTYFNAITPSDLTENDYAILSDTYKQNARIYHKFTRLPVLLSFIMCFIDSLVKGYNTIVIFEDDVRQIVNLKEINESLGEFDKSDCDVFYMGYCFLSCRQLTSQYKNLVELSYPDMLCCHSMAIKTKVLAGLIDYCFPMKTNSDEMFRDYYIHNKIKVCVPKTVYFTQNRKDLGSLNKSVDDPDLFKTCNF